MKTHLLLTAAALLACGSPNERQSCSADGDCPSGSRCETTSEGGICWPADFLVITEPTSGLYGAEGAPVTVRLVLGRAGGVAPPTIDLFAGEAAAGTLQRRLTSGVETEYAGTYLPSAGTNGPVTLSARAAVSGAVLASAPVVVTVDTTPPTLTNVVVTCSVAHPDGKCRRDDALQVSATAADANGVRVSVTLDVDGDRLTRELGAPVGGGAAGAVSGTLQLRDWPFPFFERSVAVTLTARDAVLQPAVASAAVPVTRLRWARQVEDGVFSLSGVAVVNDGLLAVGGSNGRLYRVNMQGDVVGTPTQLPGAISAAPSVGPSAIWVGSDDTRVYAVDPATGAILNGAGCATGGAVRGPPAVTLVAPETAFVTAQTGGFHAANFAGCRASAATDGFETGAVVESGSAITSATSVGSLLRLTFNGTLFSSPTITAVSPVAVPLAIATADAVISASVDGTVRATPGPVLASGIGIPTASPIVLGNGDVLISASNRTVRRISATGSAAWTATLDHAPLSPTALIEGDARFIVPTIGGALVALGDGGAILWSGALTTSAPLTDANLHTTPGSTTSTAYVGGGNVLFAVIVDGRLDTAAPWPKAHHDTRNSGNAAGPLP